MVQKKYSCGCRHGTNKEGEDTKNIDEPCDECKNKIRKKREEIRRNTY